MTALDTEPVFTPAKEGNVNCLEKLGGCFISGTRVHTDEGLKQIEEIRIGDLVLSSPQDGTSGTEYKRVTNTFRYKAKTLLAIRYHREGNDQARIFLRLEISCIGLMASVGPLEIN